MIRDSAAAHGRMYRGRNHFLGSFRRAALDKGMDVMS